VWPCDRLRQPLPLGRPSLTVGPHRATGNQASLRCRGTPNQEHHRVMAVVGPRRPVLAEAWAGDLADQVEQARRPRRCRGNTRGGYGLLLAGRRK
jgi:hypothetical protein